MGRGEIQANLASEAGLSDGDLDGVVGGTGVSASKTKPDKGHQNLAFDEHSIVGDLSGLLHKQTSSETSKGSDYKDNVSKVVAVETKFLSYHPDILNGFVAFMDAEETIGKALGGDHDSLSKQEVFATDFSAFLSFQPTVKVEFAGYLQTESENTLKIDAGASKGGDEKHHGSSASSLGNAIDQVISEMKGGANTIDAQIDDPLNAARNQASNTEPTKFRA